MGFFSKLFGKQKKTAEEGGSSASSQATNPTIGDSAQADPQDKMATPLFLAVLNQDAEAVKAILDEGADPNAKSFVGYTPNTSVDEPEPGVPEELFWILARRKRDNEDFSDGHFYDPNLGITNLHFPAKEGNITIVRLLLEAGADPNEYSFDGSFPLEWATIECHAEIVKELLNHGANPDQADKGFGHTALMAAAARGYKGIALDLLEHGADSDLPDNFGRTALRTAEEYRHASIAELLRNYELAGRQQRSADNRPNQQVLTDFFATGYGQELLRRRRANESENPQNRSENAGTVPDADSAASSDESREQANAWLLNEWLYDEGTCRDPEVAIAIANQDLARLSRAIESGCDVNMKYVHAGKKITPLVEAAIKNNEEMFTMLLQAGADPNVAMNNGETALMNAAQNGNAAICKALLDAGANPNAVAYAGTALAVADNVAIIWLLCANGADPNIPDRDGDLPIVGFIDQHRCEAVRELLAWGTNPDHENKKGESVVIHAINRRDRAIIDLFTKGYREKTPSYGMLSPEAVRVLEVRIPKLLALEYPLDRFVPYEPQSRLFQSAIEEKRAGNLEASNGLYEQLCIRGSSFAQDTIRAWFKVLLLAKDFEGAHLVLKYWHAVAASKNHLLRNIGELDFNNTPILDCFLTLDFDAFVVFRDTAEVYPAHKKAVESKIASYGGSSLWANYRLGEREYDCFLRYFFHPEVFDYQPVEQADPEQQ